MVRCLLRLHTQKDSVLHWTPREVYALEVRVPFLHDVLLLTVLPFTFRQTVFYTSSTITISEGEKIRGTLTCAPNERNNRDLDITIDYGTTDGLRGEMRYKM